MGLISIFRNAASRTKCFGDPIPDRWLFWCDSQTVDLDLMIEVRRRPEFAFVLLGVFEVDVTELRTAQRTGAGPQPYETMPQYLYH
jgi:hypothetical protein